MGVCDVAVESFVHSLTPSQMSAVRSHYKNRKSMVRLFYPIVFLAILLIVPPVVCVCFAMRDVLPTRFASSAQIEAGWFCENLDEDECSILILVAWLCCLAVMSFYIFVFAMSVQLRRNIERLDVKWVEVVKSIFAKDK